MKVGAFSVQQIAEEATTSAQRVGAEIRGAAAYGEAVQTIAPDPQTIAALPGATIGAVSGMAAAHDAYWNVYVSGSSAKDCRAAAAILPPSQQWGGWSTTREL